MHYWCDYIDKINVWFILYDMSNNSFNIFENLYQV
jgi:hypothetical protein